MSAGTTNAADEAVTTPEIVDDLTEPRRSEERMALLAAIVDSSSDAIISQTTQGLVTSWNDAAFHLYGYTAAEVLGRPITALNVHAPEVLPYFGKVMSGTRPQAMNTTASRKDGARIDVRLTFSPIIGSNSAILGIATIARDRTEHQDLNSKLEASEAVQQQLTADLDFIREDLSVASHFAREAAIAKDNFLANMSHELRTPINAILGFAEVLCNEEDVAHAPAHRMDAFQTILRDGNNLLKLIDNILDFSRLEAGSLPCETSECIITDLVQSVLSAVLLQKEDPRVTVTADIGPLVPVTIRTDQRRVRQILIRLLSNAIKFTPCGEVKLLVRRVEDASHFDDKLAFEVVDTGIGITAADMGKLFEPFSQVDSSTTRPFGGTRLGLALSKRLAESLGGELKVRSKLGVGSTFTLIVGYRLATRRRAAQRDES